MNDRDKRLHNIVDLEELRGIIEAQEECIKTLRGHLYDVLNHGSQTIKDPVRSREDFINNFTKIY